MAGLVVLAACSSSGGHPAANPTSPASAAPATPSATPSSASPALAAFYDQRLSWFSCASGFQCALLRVPLDYTNPTGSTLELAVIKLPATDPAQRIGSLIINPGGPGGSGVLFAEETGQEFPAVIREHFDIVGFDPRGVAESSPAVRCLSGPQMDQYLATEPVPHNAAQKTTLIAESRAFVNGCVQRDGNALLEHVNTLDAARDMDVLRAVLGDAKITYLGESYGTYLGARYAQLFPTHIRALVLDGALDPTLGTLQEDVTQAVGFETDLHDYLVSCVGQPGCPLGQSLPAAESALDRLLQSVDSHPLPGSGSRTVDLALFEIGIAYTLYAPATGWPELTAALTAAMHGSGAPMLALSDDYTERLPNGTYTNLLEANTAINCVDRPSPRDIAAYDQAAAAAAKVAPHFGASFVYGSLPCAYWPVPPAEQDQPASDPGAPPVLVVGTTRDPATPYSWAQALAHQLTGAVLLTYDSDGHTAYRQGSSCIDSAVDAYLVDLTLPPAGTVCH